MFKNSFKSNILIWFIAVFAVNHILVLAETKNTYQLIQDSKKNEKPSLTLSSDWLELGPTQLDNSKNQLGFGWGRLNCVRFHPLNSNFIIVGSGSGGIWYSENKGKTWQVSKFEDIPFTGVSDIQFSISSPNILYAVTGDADANGNLSAYSTGLIKSTDGGKNWTSFYKYLPKDLKILERLRVNPKNEKNLTMAGSNGILFSNDAGLTWDSALVGKRIRDLEAKVNDYNILYCSVKEGDSSIVYKSNDAGRNWKVIYKASDVRRIEIATSYANPSAVWLLFKTPTKSLKKLDATLLKSNDLGESFTEIKINKDDKFEQEEFNLVLTVSNYEENNIYIGNVSYFSTSDGGENWVHSSNELHYDFHDIQFNPHFNEVFACTDGGLYSSITNSKNWKTLSNGMHIAQIYKIEKSYLNQDNVVIATHDNGLITLEKGFWNQLSNGDAYGLLANEDAGDNVLYFDTQRNLRKLNLKTKIDTTIFDYPIQFEKRSLIIPFTQLYDSNYYFAFENLFKLNKNNEVERITNISKVEPTKQIAQINDKIYLFKESTLISYNLSNNSLSFTQIEKTNNRVKFLDLKEHGYIDFNFSNNKNEILYHANNFKFDITADLPEVVINDAIFVERINTVLIATNIGVFSLNILSNNYEWQIENRNLPYLICTDLSFDEGSGNLYLATWGYGAWRKNLYECNKVNISLNQTGLKSIEQVDSVKLWISNQPNNYKIVWNTGDTKDTIYVSKEGVYYASLIDSMKCVSVSNQVELKYSTVTSKVNLVLLGRNPFCYNYNPNLTYRVTGDLINNIKSIRWNNGKNQDTLYRIEAGQFWLEITDINNVVYKSNVLNLDTFARTYLELIRDGLKLRANKTDKIDWYRDGKAIESEKDSVLIVSEIGNYNFGYLDSNLCYQYSNIIVIDNEEAGFKIYPNPIDKILTLENYFENETNLKIIISDLSGKEIITDEIVQKGFLKKELNLEKLAIGVYNLQILTNLQITKSIIIKN